MNERDAKIGTGDSLADQRCPEPPQEAHGERPRPLQKLQVKLPITPLPLHWPQAKGPLPEPLQAEHTATGTAGEDFESVKMPEPKAMADRSRLAPKATPNTPNRESGEGDICDSPKRDGDILGEPEEGTVSRNEMRTTYANLRMVRMRCQDKSV